VTIEKVPFKEILQALAWKLEGFTSGYQFQSTKRLLSRKSYPKITFVLKNRYFWIRLNGGSCIHKKRILSGNMLTSDIEHIEMSLD